MNLSFQPALEEIQQAFNEEITAAGGELLDGYKDGRRLFLRSVLSLSEEVRPKDRIHGGVALRAADSQILIHPYTYRQVCKNGAIMAYALETRKIDRVREADSFGAGGLALEELRETVQACCDPAVFSSSLNAMRSALEKEADLALHLMSALSSFPGRPSGDLLAQVMFRFAEGSDRSVFGLMNAATSLARDQADPELRWRLEKFGGDIPAMVRRLPTRDGSAARTVLV